MPTMPRTARWLGTMATRCMRCLNRSANQLNADALSRLQRGNLGNPPPGALPYGQPPGR